MQETPPREKWDISNRLAAGWVGRWGSWMCVFLSHLQNSYTSTILWYCFIFVTILTCVFCFQSWFLLMPCVWPLLCYVVCLQVIHKHFYLKRTEIMSQCEEWITDIQQYSSDKRVGRTMSHHAAALKVMRVKMYNAHMWSAALMSILFSVGGSGHVQC